MNFLELTRIKMEEKRKAGQPKKEPTTKPSLRVSLKDWEQMKSLYPNQTNRMFNEWVKSMLLTTTHK